MAGFALAAFAASGCGSSPQSDALTVPASAQSKRPLPKMEPVRGNDYESQALEGSIARFVQWGNLHYGKTVLVTSADNTCKQQVDDLWNCYVTINVVKPFTGSRDPKSNQLIYISGTS